MPPERPGLFQRIVRFGYEAVTSKGLRKAPQPITRSEDAELTPVERRKLIANARDINRNFVAAAWMIRRHLDYVTTFSFQARTKNPDLNARAEKLLLNWSHKDRCDVAQRHPFRRMVRLMESRAVIDGDVFPHRLASGQLQFIEGDRIRTPNGGLPEGLTAADFTHGIQTNDFGAIKNLCVCKRQKTTDIFPEYGTGVFEQLLPSAHVFQHGFFDRFDQVRGVSPLASGLNHLRDSHEGFDYALAKMKVSQLFALAFYRDKVGNDPIDPTDWKKFKLDGPKAIDLDPGDRVEWLESKTPSNELQSFQMLVLQLSLKSLDIPFSFFNESFTN
jgi:capsid protein